MEGCRPGNDLINYAFYSLLCPKIPDREAGRSCHNKQVKADGSGSGSN